MIRCGVDIIEISRIQKAAEKNCGFLEKVFTESEIGYFKNSGCRFETLAGFFAAKEAFVKYKKIGIRGLELSEISVEHEKLGAPFVVFRGEKQQVSLNISHNKTQAVAVVCGDDGLPDLPCDDYMKSLIPKRTTDAHKGDCGRVFIVGGSEGMTGAAVLAARGALRSGSGLVTVGTVDSERAIVAGGVFEAMTVGLESADGKLSKAATAKILEFARKSDCVVFGPGLGQNEHIFDILKALLQNFEGTLVIDADGLNALSRNCDVLNERCCRVVITPHPGEMARLANITIGEVQSRREAVATEFASEYGITVVLKGKGTVIASCDAKAEDKSDKTKENASGEDCGACRVHINTTGNCGMATGGTGDVLSGVVGAFAAQGLEPYEAAVLGAYIHGKAGDIAAEKYGVHGLVAGDVAETVAFAIKSEFGK